MRKQILAAIIRGDKAIPLCIIEPLHGTCWHRPILKSNTGESPELCLYLNAAVGHSTFRPLGEQTQDSLIRALPGGVNVGQVRRSEVNAARETGVQEVVFGRDKQYICGRGSGANGFAAEPNGPWSVKFCRISARDRGGRAKPSGWQDRRAADSSKVSVWSV
jgi:hypothetical protein